MKRLTAKQQRFVDEFCRCWNGSEAARRADYNPDFANKTANKLRRDPKYAHVQAALAKALEDQEAQAKIQHQAQTELFMQTITANPQRLKDKHGEWIPLEDLDPEDARQIASFQDNSYENEGGQKGRSLSYKFLNPLKAAELLGKHNGYFADRATAGPDARYGEARENLHRMFARVKRRSEEPTPGDVDAGGGS